MGHLLKLGTLLLPPVDPVHQVLYVSKARVASLLPLWAFQVPVVLVFWRRGEAGGTETGRGEKRLGRRVRGLALRHHTLQAKGDGDGYGGGGYDGGDGGDGGGGSTKPERQTWSPKSKGSWREGRAGRRGHLILAMP